MKIILTLALSFVCSLGSVWAQKITLKTDQDPLLIKVDENKTLHIVADDENGESLDGGTFIYQRRRHEGFVPTSGAQVDSLGNVTGHSPGIYNLIVFRTGPDNKKFAKRYVEVQVAHLETTKIEVLDFPDRNPEKLFL